jgi:DNA invertase Pin-like site-specific DNA recombinase
MDAQHEACSAYIASQRHEGWKLIKRRFDDGGISGGTLERPALQSLLIDVDQGLVDMIVVYKIDRLTRSLSDFAKLIDRLEAKAVLLSQSPNPSTPLPPWDGLL